METIEPIYHALNTSDMQLLFDTLGIKRYPITKKAEKNKYKHIFNQSELSELLHGSIKSDTESFVSVIVASV